MVNIHIQEERQLDTLRAIKQRNSLAPVLAIIYIICTSIQLEGLVLEAMGLVGHGRIHAQQQFHLSLLSWPSPTASQYEGGGEPTSES